VVTETLGWVASAPVNTTSPGAGTGDYSPEMDPGWFASMMVAIVQGDCVLAHAQQDPVAFGAMVVGGSISAAPSELRRVHGHEPVSESAW